MFSTQRDYFLNSLFLCLDIREYFSLLKIQSHQELATRVLIAAIESSDDEISETATKALGEFGLSNIQKVSKSSENEEQESTFLTFEPPYTGKYGECLYSKKTDRWVFRPVNEPSIGKSCTSYEDCKKKADYGA